MWRPLAHVASWNLSFKTVAVDSGSTNTGENLIHPPR